MCWNNSILKKSLCQKIHLLQLFELPGGGRGRGGGIVDVHLKVYMGVHSFEELFLRVSSSSL